MKVKKELKWVELHLGRSVDGDMREEGKRDGGQMGGGGGGRGGGADRQADSSAVTDDRVKQRLARDSRPALSSHSLKKKNTLTGCWSAGFQASWVFRVFSGTMGSAQELDTPKGVKRAALTPGSENCLHTFQMKCF